MSATFKWISKTSSHYNILSILWGLKPSPKNVGIDGTTYLSFPGNSGKYNDIKKKWYKQNNAF